MKNRLIPCVLACLMIFLVGCTSNTAKEAAQEITKTETSFPAGNTETNSQEDTAEEPESTAVQEETPITSEESKSTAESQTVATVQTKPAEEKTADTPATEKPKAEPPKQTTTQAEPEKQPEQPKEPTTAEQKPLEKPTEKPAEPKPTEPPKQTFDVSPYVSYAMSMQTVVQEINQEYDDRLEQEKNSVSYDVLEMSGSRAVWKEVLAVYSVKVNTDPDNPMEVATVDETKKQLLSDIFWEMNDISSRTESKTHTEIEESDDGHGNIVQTETTVTETFLYITVSHKTVDEMAAMYGFNQEQKDYLAELLQDENSQLWSQVLYGIGYSDDQIVTVALSQVGNVGGQPYWSWYGFDSRVEWCACFVSWCANECGYIDAGIIPKYAGCVNGVQWFRDRGQWADASYEPSPGTIIFFDWEGDGVTDHTGIVQKCENGTVYTVEGNSGDTCRTKTYPVGSSVIYGYGIPAY